MSKPLKELPKLVRQARGKGYVVAGGTNGGGWHRLAISLGFDGPSTKLEAKAYVREKILQVPASQTMAEHQTRYIAYKKKVSSAGPGYKGDVNSDEFLQSFQWRSMRMKVLQKYGRKCMCCGASPETGAVMHVDHIKPRRQFPQLALEFENLQVLCHECNHGKGNWDHTDWRTGEAA